MLAKSNQSRRRRKLALTSRPYDGFPLSVHTSGKFREKVKLHDGTSKFLYCGAWAKRERGQLVPVAGDGWKAAPAGGSSTRLST
jgi:hypothetical protein